MIWGTYSSRPLCSRAGVTPLPAMVSRWGRDPESSLLGPLPPHYRTHEYSSRSTALQGEGVRWGP